MSTSQTTDSSHSTKLRETSTFDNVGPVPEKDPMMHSRNIDENQDINRQENKDFNRDYNNENLNEPAPSRGIVGTVMDAAMSAGHQLSEAAGAAAQQLRGALMGNETTRTEEMERDRIDRTNENLRFEDDRTRDISGKSTTDKLKDTAYDTKEKIKDAAYDAKEKIQDTAHDIRNSSNDSTQDMKDKAKDTAHDIKNQTKDVAHDVKNQTKDVAHDIQNQTKDVTHDVQNKSKDFAAQKRDNSLSADSEIAADSNAQRLQDIKEKVKDAAGTPVAMAQNMYEAGKERLKEAFSPATENSAQLQDTPGTSDMFSQDYLPGAAQVQTESTTEQAKSKLASTAADVAGKAENWIADNKPKLNEQADKAQELAADAKYTANKKAQESGNEPATDTRYYSGVHGQTY